MASLNAVLEVLYLLRGQPAQGPCHRQGRGRALPATPQSRSIPPWRLGGPRPWGGAWSRRGNGRQRRDRPAGENRVLAAGIFRCVRVGERIVFNDGRIGGAIQSVAEDRIRVEITNAAGGAAKLRGEKGINLSDSGLDLPALTDKEIEDLAFVAGHGDMVALSFVQQPEDETQRQRLPLLLLAAKRQAPEAVMAARGDLGVEVGFERLSEVQEEILWICEAANVPVVWATQVLGSLAKDGMPCASSWTYSSGCRSTSTRRPRACACSECPKRKAPTGTTPHRRRASLMSLSWQEREPRRTECPIVVVGHWRGSGAKLLATACLQCATRFVTTLRRAGTALRARHDPPETEPRSPEKGRSG